MPQIHTTISQPLILAGRNGTFRIGPQPGIKNLWTSFMEDFGKIEGQVGFKAYGVCHNFDGRGNMDYMAAAEVSSQADVPNYLRILMIPERKVAIYSHGGGVDTISKAWDKLFKSVLPQAGLKVADGPQFEAYDFTDNDAPGQIDIHIPVL
jgi:AraC family transcriptional regulator